MLTKQAYLKAMGIEVWTLRPSPQELAARQQVSAPVAGTPKTAPLKAEPLKKEPLKKEPAKTGSVTQPRPDIEVKAESAGETPRFRIALMHYESIGLVVSLEAGTTLPKRMCDDIARMMGGNVSGLKYQLLEWPMLSTKGIDQSLSAARQVVTQKFGVMPEKVLVVGSDVATYFGPLADLNAHTPQAVGRQSFVLVPELSQMMNSIAAKRQLMTVLHDWLKS